jgi:hypothetical protein
MPALPDVPQVARITVKQSVGEDVDVINRIFIKYSGTAPTDSDMSTYCESAFNSWVTNMSPLQDAVSTLLEVLGEDLTSNTSAVGNFTGSHAGTGSGAGVPAGVAAVISAGIARRYRGGHPRTYIGGLLASYAATAQTWNSTFITDLEEAWGTWTGDLVSTDLGSAVVLSTVNVSYYEGFHAFEYPSGRYRNIPTLRSTPVVDTITGYTVSPKIASQRRRNLQSS